jgi:hypothetical protein
MGSKVYVNGQGWTHAKSGAVSMGWPDVCKTGPFNVPIPYNNTARSSSLQNGTTNVKVEGASAAIEGCCYSESTGDEAGTGKGLRSDTIKGKAEFINYSNDVFCEGKPVCRNADPMTHNNKNGCFGINQDSSASPPTPKALQPPKETLRIKVVEHLSWDNYDKQSRRFKLGHEDNKVLAGQKFKIKLPDGSTIEKTTDDKGFIELTGQDTYGRFEITHKPEGATQNSRCKMFSKGLMPLIKQL